MGGGGVGMGKDVGGVCCSGTDKDGILRYLRGNCDYFSLKTYVVSTHLNRRGGAILMSNDSIYLWRIVENYPTLIIKYPSYYLFYWVWDVGCDGWFGSGWSGEGLWAG